MGVVVMDDFLLRRLPLQTQNLASSRATDCRTIGNKPPVLVGFGVCAALQWSAEKSGRHGIMPGGRSGVVLKDLHTLFRVGTAGGLTDGQLLERFLSQRDEAGEAAFRALVERHAPMVLRICRDVLGDRHEAEDASQATFIVLACKASSIRKRESISSWLFGVATRVAAQAKAKAARRRRHEERNAELAAAKIVMDDPRVDWFDLYEEIDRLPEHFARRWCSATGKVIPNRRPPPSSAVRCARSRTVSHEVATGCGVGSPVGVCLPRWDCGRRR